MADTVTLSIKTTPAIKDSLQQAADRLGLSLNAFVVMVAKDAASKRRLTLDLRSRDEQALDRAEVYNATHATTSHWSDIKADYGV